ncbi:MAG: YqgE/AlgH family protein [Paracoccaceae bacterium]|nr:YqgE/AlgH family protein [Paracoccaceae bacterium]MDG2258837.1 YqgE/AlgH family protein [Paracoccaceae bacterium]
MPMLNEITDLTGKLLIAMPDMGDPRFEKSVILVCSHSSEGSMGLIVNKCADEVKFPELLDQLKVHTTGQVKDTPVHFGGPVETGRGFVLHSDDFDEDEASMEIPGGYRVTATVGILEALAQGDGPSQSLMALGYAGWGPGQLEGELQNNGWLASEADSELVFSSDNDAKWNGALKNMGISAMHLSGSGGRA